MTKPWQPGDPKVFAVGDRAKWVGEHPKPACATCNPPMPGWKPPTPEEREFIRKVSRNMHVVVTAADENGRATSVRDADGFEFSPAISPNDLAPASYPGWEPPIHAWFARKARLRKAALTALQEIGDNASECNVTVSCHSYDGAFVRLERCNHWCDMDGTLFERSPEVAIDVVREAVRYLSKHEDDGG